MKKLMVNLAAMLLSFSGISCGKEVIVEVVGGDGKPIEGAEVVVWFNGHDTSREQRVTGKTNVKGVISMRGGGDDLIQLSMDIEKNDYYKNSYRHKYGTAIPAKDASVIRLKSILKRRVKPIPLFVRDYGVSVPEQAKKVGFDFEVGDFVAPYGKGKTIDAYFEQSYAKRGIRDYTYKLNISFPHEKDGIQSFLVGKDDLVSELKSPHSAPIAKYAESFSRHRIRRGMGSKVETNKIPNRNHWMRVRTKTDDKGNITSANYVKIYGDFPEVIYYFNPTPNDRNLEFDPSGNLSKNLENKHRKFAP